MNLSKEQFTDGKYKMGHIFDKSSDPFYRNYLIVTFSAVPAADSVIKHRYSFGNVLSDIPANKLYLQDSLGEMGTYYMCKDMDFSVTDVVQGIIEKFRTENNVSKENCILLGSSKGATAALYHALKGNYGHVIAMGPQIKLAYYFTVSISSTPIWRDMVGYTFDEDEAKSILDNVMINTLCERKDTFIHLLTSKRDKEFPVHIEPLLRTYFDPLNSKNDITIDNRIMDHKDLINFNPQFVRSKLFQIFSGLFDDYLPREYVFSNNAEAAQKHLLSSAAFRKETVEKESELKHSYTVTVNDRQATVTVDYDKSILKILFLFKLFKGRDVVTMTKFSKLNSYTFDLSEPGKYTVRCYIRSGDLRYAFSTVPFEIKE